MKSLTIGEQGQIALPQDLRDRYGFASNTQVRVVETQAGILLMPQSDEPMSQELAQELSDWQSLGQQTWGSFPYEDEEAS